MYDASITRGMMTSYTQTNVTNKLPKKGRSKRNCILGQV